ncbi:unnamed protein product, partial [Allacma fusca]
MTEVNFELDWTEEWVTCNVCRKSKGLVTRGSIYVCSVECYVTKKAGRPVALNRAKRMWVEKVVFP